MIIKSPYSLSNSNKKKFFQKKIKQLTNFHFKNCYEYKKILKFFNYNIKKKYKIEQLPFLPVQIFKDFQLMSVNEKKVVKVMRSSGTSTSNPAKIFLDKENLENQARALKQIFQFNFGEERLPMLVIENESNIKKKNYFDAKMAAFYGFSKFGKNYEFVINDENNLDYFKLNNFLEKFNKQKFLIVGFTSVVYENLIKRINIKKIKKNFANGILIHGGGWKKIEDQKIPKQKFNFLLKKNLKIKDVFNYYGLVEQTGSIFFECKCGYFISTDFSEIIIRDANFKLVNNGQKGFIQLLSTLSTSYPGHNILTQDIGEIVDKSLCSCKLNGKRFLVHGRSKVAEIRGCSDA